MIYSWFGMVWYGLVWYDLVWADLTTLYSLFPNAVKYTNVRKLVREKMHYIFRGSFSEPLQGLLVEGKDRKHK